VHNHSVFCKGNELTLTSAMIYHLWSLILCVVHYGRENNCVEMERGMCGMLWESKGLCINGESYVQHVMGE